MGERFYLMDKEIMDGNVAAIVDYIREGETTHGGTHMLGFELEHFVVDAETGTLVPYASSEGYSRPGVEDVLHELDPLYEGEIQTLDMRGERRVLGQARKGAPITIEPGAQMEVSIGPCENAAQIETIYRRFRADVDPVLEDMGYKLVTRGYHPTAMASQIPLIPKHRYAMMDEYFHSTGNEGICMMRAGASTQVSIDYDGEADAMRKMKVASAMGPLMFMACDNAPVFEGELVGVAGGSAKVTGSGLPVPNRMVRAHVWENVDHDRCLAAPFLYGEDPSYESYARMLLGLPPILTLDSPGDDSTSVYHGSTPAEEIYAGRELARADIEHILSMFFYDVRLKQYIEIRQPDSMPIEYGLSFATLVRGIFYDQAQLDRLAAEFEGIGLYDIKDAVDALTLDGYGAQVYGRPAYDWLDEIMGCAHDGICALHPEGDEAARDAELAYLDPLADLVARRTTLVEQAGR